MEPARYLAIAARTRQRYDPARVDGARPSLALAAAEQACWSIVALLALPKKSGHSHRRRRSSR